VKPLTKAELEAIAAMRKTNRVKKPREPKAEPEFVAEETHITVDPAVRKMSSANDVEAQKELRLD